MYKISVIIPMFKARDYIDCCLASLGRQGLTEEELEVLFIDDCSPDNTYEYAREAASGRANIRVLKQEKTAARAGPETGESLKRQANISVFWT